MPWELISVLIGFESVWMTVFDVAACAGSGDVIGSGMLAGPAAAFERCCRSTVFFGAGCVNSMSSPGWVSTTPVPLDSRTRLARLARSFPMALLSHTSQMLVTIPPRTTNKGKSVISTNGQYLYPQSGSNANIKTCCHVRSTSKRESNLLREQKVWVKKQYTKYSHHSAV